MKKLLIALAAVMITAATYGQGQVVFANRVGAAGLDAPVTVAGSNPQVGPGATWSAQLYLVSGTTFTALTPPTTFRPAGTGAAAIQDRYWVNQTVDVPGVAPGNNATFVVRAWQTSLGSYDAAVGTAWGESGQFTVAVGGGTLPPANLTTLQAFTVTIVPEPSVIALGVLGAAALLLRRRK